MPGPFAKLASLANLGNRNLHLMLAAESACFAASLSLAYLLRFDFSLPEFHASQLVSLLPLVIGLKLCVFLALGLYRGMWRYTSLADFTRLAEAALLSSALLVAFAAYRHGLVGYSRAVLAMDGVLTLLSTTALRLGIRVLYARSPRQGPAPKRPPRRALVIGAGGLGERLLRETVANPGLGVLVVGFLDDDADKRGRSLHGRSVLGGVAELSAVAEDTRAEEILIAVAKASAAQMRRILAACEASGLPHRILPPTEQLLEGRAAPALRPVDYQDLLGRSEVVLDETAVAGLVRGHVVLVTGCGGSIGSELCRQVARLSPARLVLVDASEYNLYAIARELKAEMGFAAIERVLADVADESRMERVFAHHRPALVLHAAAYKHVPMLEENPWAAVTNNVAGARVLMRMAVAHGVERFVLVSTDKAVRPTSVMGASKRVAERLLERRAAQALDGASQGRTRFMAVRFGNVVGSSGSVVPLFRRQVERGGPVTVTHPDMTRFFMSIAEACQLILQAAALGGGGEIFVLKMGEPVRIMDLAHDVIRLSGKTPGVDVDIVVTGLRPGEKLHEELVGEGEEPLPTAHEKILVLRPMADAPGAGELDALCDELERVAKAQDAAAIRALFARLAPGFEPATAPKG